MTYARAIDTEPILGMVSVLGPWGREIDQVGVPLTNVWEAASRTVYMPISVPVKCILRRFWWANGSTVNAAANYIAAIYTDVAGKPGRRLNTTAATAQGTASEVQFVTPSATNVLVPGGYWFALASNSATTTHIMSASLSGAYGETIGGYQEATATPPATATPATRAGALLWLCGFSTETTP
jgi:hypothetical protein